MYIYYNLTRLQLSIYKGLVSIAGLLFGLTILIKIFITDKSKLNKTYKYFLFFLIMVIIFELYLETRFEGKG
jgi:uncharacterized membrane protein YoaT (DUF817 family)